MKQFSTYLSAAFLAVSLVPAAGSASTATNQSTDEYIDTCSCSYS